MFSSFSNTYFGSWLTFIWLAANYFTLDKSKILFFGKMFVTLPFPKQSLVLMTHGKTSFENMVGKGKNAGNIEILPY